MTTDPFFLTALKQPNVKQVNKTNLYWEIMITIVQFEDFIWPYTG